MKTTGSVYFGKFYQKSGIKKEHANFFQNTSGTSPEYGQDASGTHSEQTEDLVRAKENADQQA